MGNAIAQRPVQSRKKDRSFRPCAKAPSRRLSAIEEYHLFRIDNLIKRLLVNPSSLKRGLLQRRLLIKRLVRNLRRFVVTDHRAEGSYEHQRLLHKLGDAFFV